MCRMYFYIVTGIVIFSHFTINVTPANSYETSKACQKTQLNCSDCNTLMICMKGRPPMHVPCSGDLSFCNNGTCSKSPQIGIDCPNSSFNCPNQDGVYPDLSNCSLYHLCMDSVAYDYPCPTGQKYSVKTKTCSLFESECQLVNCTDLNGVWRSHPEEPQIMYLCIHGTAEMIDICPKHFIYNDTMQRCEFRCRKEGLTADPEDPSKFYECLKHEDIKKGCPAPLLVSQNHYTWRSYTEANCKLKCYDTDCVDDNKPSSFFYTHIHRNCPSGSTFDDVEQYCRLSIGENQNRPILTIDESTTPSVTRISSTAHI